MRILFYSHSSTIYGATSSLHGLILGLRDLDASLNMHVILPSDGPFAKLLKSTDISFSIIPNYKWTFSKFLYDKKAISNKLVAKLWHLKHKYLKGFKNLVLLREHVKFAKEYKPDLIYVNSSMAPMGTIVARKVQTKFIWHHRETINDIETGFYLDNTKLFIETFKEAYVHVYPSKFLKSYYEKFSTIGQHFVSFNGVFVNQFEPKKTNSYQAPVKFGIIGRINNQKGQEEVLDLFKELSSLGERNFELYIYGGGEVSYINKLKRYYNGGNVYFEGFTSKDNIYNNIDFLISNAKNESFGRVVAEANAYGIPAIVLNSGAFPEIVRVGSNGFIYHDIKELKQLILMIINSFTDHEYKTLAASSREMFEKKFSIQTHANEIYKYLSENINP